MRRLLEHDEQKYGRVVLIERQHTLNMPAYVQFVRRCKE
jgi:hypothetical protein